MASLRSVEHLSRDPHAQALFEHRDDQNFMKDLHFRLQQAVESQEGPRAFTRRFKWDWRINSATGSRGFISLGASPSPVRTPQSRMHKAYRSKTPTFRMSVFCTSILVSNPNAGKHDPDVYVPSKDVPLVKHGKRKRDGSSGFNPADSLPTPPKDGVWGATGDVAPSPKKQKTEGDFGTGEEKLPGFDQENIANDTESSASVTPMSTPPRRMLSRPVKANHFGSEQPFDSWRVPRLLPGERDQNGVNGSKLFGLKKASSLISGERSAAMHHDSSAGAWKLPSPPREMVESCSAARGFDQTASSPVYLTENALSHSPEALSKALSSTRARIPEAVVSMTSLPSENECNSIARKQDDDMHRINSLKSSKGVASPHAIDKRGTTLSRLGRRKNIGNDCDADDEDRGRNDDAAYRFFRKRRCCGEDKDRTCRKMISQALPGSQPERARDHCDNVSKDAGVKFAATANMEAVRKIDGRTADISKLPADLSSISSTMGERKRNNDDGFDLDETRAMKRKRKAGTILQGGDGFRSRMHPKQQPSKTSTAKTSAWHTRIRTAFGTFMQQIFDNQLG